METKNIFSEFGDNDASPFWDKYSRADIQLIVVAPILVA
jgi:hypothetical protein